MIEALSVLFTLAVILRVFNTLFIKLPSHIGLFIFGFVFAILVLASQEKILGFYIFFSESIINVKFENLLLDGFLGFLLFAGALHVNLEELDCSKWAVFLFSTLGVAITSSIVGTLIYGVAPLLGLELPFLYALLFGALI